MSEFIKVCHRNGAVFVRMVFDTKAGRTSRVCRMTPKEANALADSISKAANGALGKSASAS